MTGLLLVIVVEPGSALLNDVLGFDFGIAILYVTLGVAGLALILIRQPPECSHFERSRRVGVGDGNLNRPPPGGARNVSRC
jgi:hypothetical protein